MGNIDPNLFERYFNNELNASELEALQNYLQLSDLAELEVYMARRWKEKSAEAPLFPPPPQEDMWQDIRSQIKKAPQDRPFMVRPLYRIAAAIALLVVSLALTFWFNRPEAEQLFSLNNQSSEVKKLTLPDGSQVWLNRNSELSYGPDFGDSLRSVQLVGEAFFEVAKDSLHPFLVHTATLSTQVLGTAFNVQALDKSDRVKVALMEGKVRVQVHSAKGIAAISRDLEPGDLLVYDKSRDSTVIGQYAADAPYAWKEGVIQFDGANVHEVMSVLGQWYGLELSIMGDTAKMTTELVHRYDANSMTLQEVLTGIGSVADYRFEEIDERTFVVKPD